ncbi:MAG: SDR family oxidoreductase [Candidatus Omnitrophica bacterium]|nr:SDR family oxidoreductase [Candidatus Omnitrophota bacterium]
MLYHPQPKKILITGGSGFLGWHLAVHLSRRHHVAVTYRSRKISIPTCQVFQLDLERPFTIKNCLTRFNPDIIIHAAAMANTTACKQNFTAARNVNVRGAERLLRSIVNPGALFVYISTDLVFDGEHAPYREKDDAHPIGVYGLSKLEAERAVRKLWPNHIILRTALLYGPSNPFGRGSFLQWLDGGLQRSEPLNLFSDEYRTPAYVGDVVRAVQDLIRREIHYRTYHIGGPERISRADFGKRLAKMRGFDDSCIHEVTLEEMNLASLRARDASLDSSLIQRTCLLRLTPIDDALKQIFP